MSFQFSILKILAGQPSGVASLEVVKQHLAIFYTSGPEWPARMKRLSELAPNLDIFGQKFVARELGAWRITDGGRTFLDDLERSSGATPPSSQDDQTETDSTPMIVPVPIAPKRRLEDRRQQRRNRSKRGDQRKA
ncbi:hypothetical protein AB4Z51_40025 [Bradyrhizobium sp. 2TAF36]|uniref:hypothetical protein n=1 Tax=Bradyrhizobium sp. 2TAF36 TaxID=3233016 RepID=UPI003F936454